jgi:hypothetical protein
MVVVSRKKDRMFWEPPNDLGKLWKPPSTVSEDALLGFLGHFVDLVEVVR